jgi:beta-glucanase (GH16 family)
MAPTFTRKGLLLAALAGAGLFAGLSGSPAQDGSPLRATPDGRPLQLVFSEDFDTFRPWRGRSGIWRTTYGDGTHEGLDRRSLPTNGELQLYVDSDIQGPRGSLRLNPFSLNRGVLEITAVPTPRELRPLLLNYGYMSGLITTQPSFSQTYGYFEMRARLPQGKGLWPAFWLLPTDQSWPPEIDVMESIGDPSQVFVTTHSKVVKREGFERRIAPGVFHVFAASWDERNVIWYIDGREAGRHPTPDDMHKPMFMLANLAVGGHWPGSPDASTKFPARYEIDYIRAYRFAR